MAERRRGRKTDEENFRGNTSTEGEERTIEVEYVPPKHYQTPPAGETRAIKEHKSMSMIDPSEWELEDSQEPYALKDGTEARLRIIEVTKSKRDTGIEYFTVRFEVPGEPFSKDITDWFDEPSRSMDAKRLNASKQKMLHFLDCFSIDRSRPSDPSDDWVGQEGWCLLSLRKSDEYGEQNRISKFIIPR